MKKVLSFFIAALLVVLLSAPSAVKADDPTPSFTGQMPSQVTWTADTTASYGLRAVRPDGSTDGLKFEWFIVYKGTVYDIQDSSWEASKSVVPSGHKISSTSDEYGYTTLIISGIDPDLIGAELFCICRDDKYGTLVQSERTYIEVVDSTVKHELRDAIQSGWFAYKYSFNCKNEIADPSDGFQEIHCWSDVNNVYSNLEASTGIKVSDIEYTWYEVSKGDNNYSQAERLQSISILTDPFNYDPITGENGLIPVHTLHATDYYVCMLTYHGETVYGPVIRVDWNESESSLEYTAPDPYYVGVAFDCGDNVVEVEVGTSVNDLPIKARFTTPMGYGSTYSVPASRFSYFTASGSPITKFNEAGDFTIRAVYGNCAQNIKVKVKAAPTPTSSPTPTPTNTPTPTTAPTSTPTPTPTNTPSPTTAPTNTPTPEPTKEETPTPEPTQEATPTPEPTQEAENPTQMPVNTPTPTLPPTPTNAPTNSPTPIPGESATRLNVPLVVILVVVIALLAAAIGVLTTIIVMKNRNSGAAPVSPEKAETPEEPETPEKTNASGKEE